METLRIGKTGWSYYCSEVSLYNSNIIMDDERRALFYDSSSHSRQYNKTKVHLLT